MVNTIESFAYVAVGAELLAGGVDISKHTRDSIKELVRDSLPEKYLIDVDEDTKELFNLPTVNVCREKGCVWCLQKVKKKEHQPNLTLTIDKVKSIMEVLYTAGIETFAEIDESVYITGFKEKIDALDAEVDYTKAFDCDIKNKLKRADTQDALKIFLALCNYPNKYSLKLFEDSKVDKTFHLKDFKDFEVVDNRIIIPFKPSDKRQILKYLKAKGIKECEISTEIKEASAFVISKNVYDYFWASYGNAFQSCFSLNSDYNYLFGYIPFAVADESFMCYATTGKVNKIPVISGNQWLCPNMIFRTWAYASSDEQLIIDKRYRKSDNAYSYFVEIVLDILEKKFNAHTTDDEETVVLYNDGKGLYDAWQNTRVKFYSDSLRCFTDDKKVDFCYNCGTKSTHGDTPPWKSGTFLAYASKVKEVSSTLDLGKDIEILDGKLINPKVCPVTHLRISDELEQSPYAKYLTSPVDNLLVFSYIDGHIFLDAATKESNAEGADCIGVKNDAGLYRGFVGGYLWIGPYSAKESSNVKVLPLKSLKEFIKGHIKDTCYDAILLRVVEPDKITIQQFRKH